MRRVVLPHHHPVAQVGRHVDLSGPVQRRPAHQQAVRVLAEPRLRCCPSPRGPPCTVRPPPAPRGARQASGGLGVPPSSPAVTATRPTNWAAPDKVPRRVSPLNFPRVLRCVTSCPPRGVMPRGASVPRSRTTPIATATAPTSRGPSPLCSIHLSAAWSVRTVKRVVAVGSPTVGRGVAPQLCTAHPREPSQNISIRDSKGMICPDLGEIGFGPGQGFAPVVFPIPLLLV